MDLKRKGRPTVKPKPNHMGRKKTDNFFYTENSFRYYVVPTVFVLFFTSVVQYLALVGQGQPWSWQQAWSNSWGDGTSWTIVTSYLVWAVFWLRAPFKEVHGPETSFGHKPVYRDNGIFYYGITTIGFCLLQVIYPQASFTLYTNFPRVLGVLNIVALTLCVWLLVKGKFFREHKDDVTEPTPLIYEFYRGVELHPRIFGVDVKQLTNSRVGMMTWQVFLFAFFVVGMERHGLNVATLVYVVIHSVYILKFFWWESGYFHTIDMMMDRGGYYLCWGCLCWMPAFFSIGVSYTIVHPPTLSPWASVTIGLFGLLFVLLTYRVDYEKVAFRASPNLKCSLWGKPAQYILAEYQDGEGKLKKSALLISGAWGVCRHLNYTFELGTTLCFCASLGFDHIWNWLYGLFIGVILFHRVLRDEEKCRNKYGRYWNQYCAKVPYVLFPGVW